MIDLSLKMIHSFSQPSPHQVERVIEELGLEKVRDSKVGGQFLRGISGGEKKRVSIGCELITDPSASFYALLWYKEDINFSHEIDKSFDLLGRADHRPRQLQGSIGHTGSTQ